MTEHTKEPWIASINGLRVFGDVPFEEPPVEICTCTESCALWGGPAKMPAKANGERIAACVSACKGIKNPEVTIPKLVDAIKDIESKLSERSAENDEIHLCGLEALVKMI